jgi:uncharacterized membrane protein
MAFCVQCGNQVRDADRFCTKCGSQQKAAPIPNADPFSGISARNAALLCYIPWVGWIAAIVVLASERFRQNPTVRFHGFQGLYVFVTWLIVEWVVAPALYVTGFMFGRGHHALANILELAVFCAWIFMMIKVSHDQTYKLPIIGDLAERSVSEQRT